jgi:hypothetical protein
MSAEQLVDVPEDLQVTRTTQTEGPDLAFPRDDRLQPWRKLSRHVSAGQDAAG